MPQHAFTLGIPAAARLQPAAPRLTNIRTLHLQPAIVDYTHPPWDISHESRSYIAIKKARYVLPLCQTRALLRSLVAVAKSYKEGFNEVPSREVQRTANLGYIRMKILRFTS